MCGLVAVITKARNGFCGSDLDLFDEMLFADTLRGKDSTGVFAVNNLGNVGIVKDAVTAENFLETPEYKKLRPDLFREGWALVGHNRKATRGDVNDVNAHPFWVDDKLVLVHNGSYFGDHKKLADTTVDSHAIAIHLANNIENYESALREVNAAYALIFYDIENKKLNIIRNKERPLYTVETNSAIFFASEPGMLSWILHRNNERPIGKIESLEELHMHTYTLESNGMTVERKKLDCSFRFTQTNYSGYGSYAGAEAWEECDPCGGYAGRTGGREWDYENNKWKDAPTQQRVLTPPTQVDPTAAAARELDRVRDLCVPDVAHPHYTHSTWSSEVKKVYPDGKRLSVIVDDWIQPDSKVKEYYLTGKTLDGGNLPVIFKVDEKTIDNLTSQINSDNFLFDIEIERTIWKRNDVVVPKTANDLAQLNGVVFVHGKNHQIVLTAGANRGQTH